MKETEIRKEWEQFIDRYSGYFLDNDTIWKNNLQLASEYIDKNHKSPSNYDKNPEIKKLGCWLYNQKTNYNEKIGVMKNPEIIQKWEQFIDKYSDYFLDNDTIWKNNLQLVSEYIDKNHKLPSNSDKNPEIKKIGSWLSCQKIKYTKKTFIMKETEIRKEWAQFIDRYSDYFLDNDTIWKNNLQLVSEYIDENHKRPSNSDKNPEIRKIGKWLSCQKTNYNEKIGVMKETEIRQEWKKFIEKYSEYFLDNNSKWKNNLQLVCEYIDKNHKRPTDSDKNPEIKHLGNWLYTQKKNYTKKLQIMKEPEIKKEWEQFINNDKYKHYFNN